MKAGMKAESWDAKKYKKTVNVAHLGQLVFDKLKAKDGERILDVGCGDGRNTVLLADSNPTLDIIGIDYSQSMVEKAEKRFGELREKGHKIKAYQGDAANLPFGSLIEKHSFDAVTSVSALHWVRDAQGAVKGLSDALKVGGRLAVEFAWQSPPIIREAILTVMERHGHTREAVAAIDPWRRTSPSEWRTMLIENGFDHDLSIQKVSRIQPLEGENGMKDWLKTFVADTFLGAIPAEKKEAVMDEICEELKSTSLYQNGKWSARYERLSIQATYERGRDISDVEMANSSFAHRVAEGSQRVR